jgi:hypothetical protein
MDRQALLAKDDPLQMWAVVDEAALRVQVGGPDVMRRQLTRILEATAEPHITVQVIPYSAGAHAGMDGAFAIMDFPDPADPQIVSVGNIAVDLLLDAEDDVRRFSLVFDNLRAVALSPDDSASLIASLAEERQ